VPFRKNIMKNLLYNLVNKLPNKSDQKGNLNIKPVPLSEIIKFLIYIKISDR